MMRRCRYCRKPLRGRPEDLGARCPRCREPLFERPSIARRLRAGADTDQGVCAAHPHNLAVGTCQRCGNYLCPVCRTRWRQKVVCTACVERALEVGEQAPEEARAHLRQAALSLVLGIAGWLVLIVVVLLVAVVMNQPHTEPALLGLLGLVLLGSPLFATLGLGQAIAAVRVRGSHMIMATSGLVLSGLQVGVVVGLFLLGIWNS